ncbi:MAG: hypothetical protein SGI77_25760 [Pirellulaceae bacterium]|nr:hypothetical protein [Pirellulaceae bacterium]
MASVSKDHPSALPMQPLHEAGNAPLLDFIKQSATAIQRTELTVGILSWMVMGLASVFVFVLVDHWVWPMNDLVRYLVWTLLVGSSLFWVVFRIAPFMGRKINPEYAAKRIEETIPEMKDGLISWLQLATHPSTPRGVLNTVGRYVAKHLKGQEVAGIIDQFNLMKLAAILFGLMLISAIYLAVSPKDGINSARRLLMPWASISPSTRVKIVEVTPGDVTVTEGSTVKVAIQVHGWHRSDKAIIRFSTDDGQTIDQIEVMRPDINGLTYELDFGKSFGGIVQPMHYSIEAGDAKAGPFAIKIQAIPLVLLEQVEYIYPAYMRLAPRVAEGDGRIEATEGTQVTILARSNQEMNKVRIEFDSKPDKNGLFQVSTADDVVLDGRSIAASLLLRLDDAKSNPTLLNYRFLAENRLGEKNAEPVVYPIKIIPDLAPEIQLARDLKDAIDLPVNQKLDLEVRASDPDFGLARVAIAGTSRDQNVLANELFQSKQGAIGQVTEVYAFDPQSLRLRPGAQIDIVATAEDNRCAPGSDLPEPNIRQSRTIRVTITSLDQNPPNDKPQRNAEDQSSKKPPSIEQKDPKETAPSNEKNGTRTPDQPANESKPDLNTKSDPGNEPDPQTKQGEQEKPDEQKTQEKQGKKGEQGKQNEPGDQAKNQDKIPPDQEPQEKGNQGTPEQSPSGQGPQEDSPPNPDESNQGQSGAGQSGSNQSNRTPNSTAGSDGNSNDPNNEAGTDPTRSDSKGKPSSNRGEGKSSDPMHDGEAFEELRDLLKTDTGSDPTNASGKPAKSDDSNSNTQRSSTPDDKASGEGKASNDSKANGSSDSLSGGNAGNENKDKQSKNPPSSQGNPATDDGKGEPTEPPATDSNASNGNQSVDSESQSASQSNNTESQSEQQGTDSLSKTGKQGSESSSKSGKQSTNSESQSGKPSTDSESQTGKKADGSDAQADKQGSESGADEGNPASDASDSSKSPSTSSKSGPSDSKSGQQGSQSKSGDQRGKGEPSSKESKGNLLGKSNSSADALPDNNDNEQLASPESVAAETEYARRATDMVLKALERQRDQPDSELLKQMGWNKEQLQAFLDRWKRARDQAAKDPNKKREYDEALRSLGLVPSSAQSKTADGRDDKLRGLNEEGLRVRPPESLRERYEAFRKSTRQ